MFYEIESVYLDHIDFAHSLCFFTPYNRSYIVFVQTYNAVGHLIFSCFNMVRCWASILIVV